MRVFTLLCSLLLIATGATGYYGWGQVDDGSRSLISAIPAFFGAAMLLGTLVAFFFPRTGLQFAFIAALAGGFSGPGRLAPSYLKETFDWHSRPGILVAAMSVVCLGYVLVAGFRYLFVRKRPVPEKVKEAESPPVAASDAAESESEVVEREGGPDGNLEAAKAIDE